MPSERTDSLRRRFRDCIEVIEKLRSEDARFSEVCADYEQISTWFAENCGPEQVDSKRCEHARELIDDLERELIKALENDKR